MAGESKAGAGEKGEIEPKRAARDTLDEPMGSGADSPVPSSRRPASFRHTLALTVGSIEDSLRWIGGKRVRLSVAVGLLAAFATAIGFTLFDAGREQWMLEHEYPAAVNSDERHTLYARDLIDARRYSKAEAILRDLLEGRQKAEPRPDALFLLGRCLVESKADRVSAIEGRAAFDDFIERFSADPRVPSAHRYVAQSLEDSGLYADSAARYGKLLRMLTDEMEIGEVRFLMARAHYMANNVRASRMVLEELQQEYAGTAVARDSMILLAKMFAEYGRAKRADSLLEELLERAPGTVHAGAALLMLARDYSERGEHERAIGYCMRWFVESPTLTDQSEIMLILARARLATGSPSETLKLASDAVIYVSDAPDGGRADMLAEAVVLKGMAHEAMGKMDEAERSYIEAIESSATSWKPYRRLAHLCRSDNRLPEAIEFMERAVKLSSEKDILWIELADLYLLSGDNDSAKATLDYFTRERRLSPQISEAFMMLADIHIELGDFQKAYRTLEILESIGATAKKKSAVYTKQGDILRMVGLTDDAVEKYRISEQNGADLSAIKLKIAGALLESRKPNECLAELKYFGLLPSYHVEFDVLDLRARALVELEEYAEARQILRRAAELVNGRQKISALASLMHVELELKHDKAASGIYEQTLKLIETDESSIQAPPESRRIILDWARRLYEKGEYIRAADAYARVSAPGFPASDVAWAIYQQGNCYFHMAEFERATESYERLASEFGDSEWARYARAKKELMSVGAET